MVILYFLVDFWQLFLPFRNFLKEKFSLAHSSLQGHVAFMYSSLKGYTLSYLPQIIGLYGIGGIAFLQLIMPSESVIVYILRFWEIISGDVPVYIVLCNSYVIILQMYVEFWNIYCNLRFIWYYIMGKVLIFQNYCKCLLFSELSIMIFMEVFTFQCLLCPGGGIFVSPVTLSYSMHNKTTYPNPVLPLIQLIGYIKN